EEARGLRQKADDESKALHARLLDQAYQQNASLYGTRELDCLCESITDGDHQSPPFQDEGVKFIFVGNVSSGYLHFNGSKRVAAEYFASIRPSRKPRRGDVLYSAVGATLGIPAVVDSDDQFCFQRHVALLRPDPRNLLAKYLWYMLRSGIVTAAAWARTTGSAQPTIPLRSIRVLEIPAPPVQEQATIVAELDNLQARLNEMNQRQQQTIAELDALLPSILDRAFKGEL
nr:restriction endonuclease subunit S [Gemmatimonadota bacterium]